MRKLVLIVLVLVLAVPAVGAAALMRGAGDGTLSVEDGHGRVVVDVRGGVIGRFDTGFVTIVDLTPDDAFEAKVWGATRVREIGEDRDRHFGTNVRFRLIGGSFRISVNGSGIDLSAVGNGLVTLEGRTKAPGLYSLGGEDCSAPRATCKELPDPAKTFRLGSIDAPEKSSSRLLP